MGSTRKKRPVPSAIAITISSSNSNSSRTWRGRGNAGGQASSPSDDEDRGVVTPSCRELQDLRLGPGQMLPRGMRPSQIKTWVRGELQLGFEVRLGNLEVEVGSASLLILPPSSPSPCPSPSPLCREAPPSPLPSPSSLQHDTSFYVQTHLVALNEECPGDGESMNADGSATRKVRRRVSLIQRRTRATRNSVSAPNFHQTVKYVASEAVGRQRRLVAVLWQQSRCRSSVGHQMTGERRFVRVAEAEVELDVVVNNAPSLLNNSVNSSSSNAVPSNTSLPLQWYTLFPATASDSEESN